MHKFMNIFKTNITKYWKEILTTKNRANLSNQQTKQQYNMKYKQTDFIESPREWERE